VEWKVKYEIIGKIHTRSSLKETTTMKFTHCYRAPIVENGPDKRKIKSAIYAILYHYMSTDNRGPHTIQLIYDRKIMPVHQRLANDNILARSSAVKTETTN
jgi:hypothetical protein